MPTLKEKELKGGPAEDAKIFKVFGIPIVCEVVAVLKDLKNPTVIEIKEKLGLDNRAGKVSNALKSLYELNAVTKKTEGKFMRYSLVYTRKLPWTVRRCIETIIGKRS